MEELQIHNAANLYALCTSLGEEDVPCILYSHSSSGVDNDPSCHAWSLVGNLHIKVGTYHTSIYSGYAYGYFDYFFNGRQVHSQIISRGSSFALCMML